MVWQEARFWKIRHLEDAAAAEFTRLQDELGPLLEARNAFVDQRRANLALRALHEGPSQALLMSLVDRASPTRRPSSGSGATSGASSASS